MEQNKESLINYIKNYSSSSNSTGKRNLMGCSEDWYNPFYSIKETFTLDEIEKMSECEIKSSFRLANNISEGLY